MHLITISKSRFLIQLLFCLFCTGCVVEESLDIDDEENEAGSIIAAGDEVIVAGEEIVTSGEEMMAGTNANCADASMCPSGTLPNEQCECIACTELAASDICPSGTELNEDCECAEINQDCICPAVFEPVCGENGQTYSNDCEAACANIEIAFQGECERDVDLACFDQGAERSCEVICNTFINCYQEECGGEIEREEQRACERDCSEEERILDQLWPVLCDRSNSCEDFAFNFSDAFGDDLCIGPTRECNEPNPDVDYVSQDPRECEQIDFGCPEGSEYYYDECGCGCLTRDCDEFCSRADLDPVCTPDGRQFSSTCHAECFGSYEYRSCDMACVCPDIYAPECGLDGRTYSNSCQRECLGIPLNYEGECGGNQIEICQEPSEDLACDQVCREVASCFEEQCTSAERMLIEASCADMCLEIEPEFICSFGSCFDLAFIIPEFTGQFIECLDVDQICPDESQGAEYVSYDPDACRLIGEIDCGEFESFNGACGCGCFNNSCPSDDQALYVSYETEACERVTFSCPEGSTLFNDDCGCGCSF